MSPQIWGSKLWRDLKIVLKDYVADVYSDTVSFTLIERWADNEIKINKYCNSLILFNKSEISDVTGDLRIVHCTVSIVCPRHFNMNLHIFSFRSLFFNERIIKQSTKCYQQVQILISRLYQKTTRPHLPTNTTTFLSWLEVTIFFLSK